MTTDPLPYTDDDVRRLALVAFPGLPAGIDAAQAERRVGAVLADLAAAGRLVPAETNWGWPTFICDNDDVSSRLADGPPTTLEETLS